MNVLEATWDEAREHPYLMGGAVVVALLAVWYFSKPSPSQTPQHFSFSYGPSDAQVRAGTALQIAQQADTTNLAMEGIKAGVAKSTSQDYFGYLTSANANATQLGELQSNNQMIVDDWRTFYGSLIAENHDQTQLLINAADNARTVAVNSSNNQTTLQSKWGLTGYGV